MRLPELLGEAGINMEYAYAYSGKEAAVLIIRVDHVDEAVRRILTQGGTLIEAKIFS